jgi:hypothetical protein
MNLSGGPSWLIFLIAILVILAVVFLFTRLFDFTPETLALEHFTAMLD